MEKFEVEGTYQLSNLLQELHHAQRKDCKAVVIERVQLEENAVHRLGRLIKESWWDNLTRRMDASGIEMAAKDPKMRSSSRIYVPPGAPEQYAYYCAVARERPNIGLEVHWLPQGEITAEFIKSINMKPGILALEMEEVRNEEPQQKSQLQGLPFIVPGGCFNELYNWDSCFCALGMFQTHKHVVKAIVRNFIFEIKHYGKILNANRSYYLGRAQPPLLTWLALKTYTETREESGALDLLRQAILAAMKEYYGYWTTPPRLDQETGLSRYRPSKSWLDVTIVNEHYLTPIQLESDHLPNVSCEALLTYFLHTLISII